MSAPTDQDMSRREELSVSGSAMSGAPWGAALVTGGVVGAADLALHGTAIGVAAFSGSVAFGAAVFLVVAGGGALVRAKGDKRAARWARNNPWRFAVLPGVAAAAIALVLTVLTGGGVFEGFLSGLWHGGAVFGLTGAIGSVTKSRKSSSSY
jgi:hypothetical protein